MRYDKFFKIFALIISITGFVGLLSGYRYIKFTAETPSPRLSEQTLAPEKNDFKVAVFGDFAMQTGVVKPIMQKISASDADIAICTGDIFRHPSCESAFYLREIFYMNLKKPYFCVAGNHDTDTDTTDPLHYYRLFCELEQYYFSYGDTLFIVLDTSDKKFDNKRFDYLVRTLKKHRADYRRCLLVTHIPPIDGKNTTNYASGELAQKLKTLPKEFHIDGIISGHLHIARVLNFSGIPVYISPTAGQRNRDPKNPEFGYLVLHFKADGSIVHNYRFIPKLKRSRNYFYGFLQRKFFASAYWFFCPLFLLLIGITILSIFSFRKDRVQ